MNYTDIKDQVITTTHSLRLLPQSVVESQMWEHTYMRWYGGQWGNLQHPSIECLGLQSVPVVHPCATLETMGCDTLEGMLRYADRLSMNHLVAEGVVFKAVGGSHVADVLYSFKCINNRYLLGES